MSNCSVVVKEDEIYESDLQSASTHTLERHSLGSADSYNLYAFIDSRTSDGANLQDPASLSKILRPHDSRHATDLENSLANLDEDDGVIINVRFTELVRIKQVMLSIPPSSSQERPSFCRIWVNRLNISFDDVQDESPDQEFEFLEEPGAVEYATKMSRFASVSNVTIYIPLRARHDRLRLYYLGFKGTSRAIKKQETDGMQIKAENAASSFVDSLKDKSAAANSLQGTAR